MGYIFAFVTVICFAASVVYTRVLWDVNPLILVFYSTLFSVPIFLILSIVTTGPENPSMLFSYDFNQWALIIGSGLIFLTSLFGLSKGA